MQIIDTQAHVWDLPNERFPWDAGFDVARVPADRPMLRKSIEHYLSETPVWPEDCLAAMQSLGVHAGILVVPTLYGPNPAFALKAATEYPRKFGVIGVLDSGAPDIAEQVEAWRSRPGALGLRILVLDDSAYRQLEAGFHDRLLAAASTYEVPVCIFPPGYLGAVRLIARRWPNLQIVIDHLGMRQPPMILPDDPPMRALPELLELAAFPNVAVKLSAAPTLSRERFPFRDLWPALHRIIDAFGTRRLMWGSDWTRVRSVLSYEEGLRYMLETTELSSAEKQQLMGATAGTLFRWPDAATA